MPDLELLHHAPTGDSAAGNAPVRRTPLLFVHGAFSGAWQWAPHYLPFFAQRGWHAHALSLAGHGKSPGTASADLLGIDDYVRDVRRTVERLSAQHGCRPALIGHSMGGFVLQKLLEGDTAPAVVLMAAVPPQGLMAATLGLAFTRPNVLLELNRLVAGGNPQLASVREALFHQPIGEAALLDFVLQCQPESLRAIWDMTLFNLPRPARATRVPLLVVGAAEDRLIPAAEVERTAAAWDVPPHIFPDMGHAMMLESNWRGPAELIARWLDETLPG